MIAGTEQRKLAAIVFTDMVGFSALSQRSESLALELLEEHRQVVRKVLPRHGGREVKTMGDGFLLEFPSALAAVEGAVEMQNAFHERNQVSPPDRQLRIRIGIHVGDVVMRDGDIHGDGVNLAARIEPLAAPGGICISSAVQEQVRNKLSQPLAALGPAELKNIELPVVVHRVVLPWEKPVPFSPPKSGRRNPAMAWALSLFLLAGLGFAIFAMRKRSTSAIPPASPPPPVASAPTSADALVAKARALLDDDPLMTRANVELAEQLSLQAIAKDPTNAEAYAAAAWANFRFLETNYEDTPQRRADLRNYAERARLLAPDSINAELAMTGVQLATDNRLEAVARLRALADRVPDNLTVLRAWAGAAQWGNGVNLGDDENSDPAALARLRAHSALGRAYADSFLANQHWAKGEYVEAERLLDGVFAAGHPVRLSYLLRLLIYLWGWGDLPAARKFSTALPAKLLLEDVFITHVSTVWKYSGEYDKALGTLDRTQREMLQEAKIQFPTALLRGEAAAAAGRPAAAAIQWREALALVDKRLAGNPGNANFHNFKALLLARLGNREGAGAEFGLASEIAHPVPGTIGWGYGYWYFAAIGDLENAVPRIDRLIARDNGRWPNDYNDLKYAPEYADLRKDPRVQAMLARGAAWLAEMRRAAALNETKGTSQPPPDDKSVAVLPFENRSAGGEDAAFLADGIQEDLINTLSRVPGLKVIARTAVMPYRGNAKNMPQIATDLRVSHLVEAGVQRAGDRVRINVQLVRAKDGQAEWSERYDRTLSATNIFALQEEITQAVANALQLKLGAKTGEKLLTGTTGNLAAYEAFLKGRKEYTDGSTEEAVRSLKEAVRLDPNYALAHGALAEAYVSLSNEGRAPAAEAYPLAKASARRALELDDQIVQAYTALGEYSFHFDWNWTEAEKAMLRALAIDPNYAIAYGRHSGHLLAWGRFEESLAADRRENELSPNRGGIAEVNNYLRQRRYQQVLDLTAKYALPDATEFLMQRGIALLRTGQQDEGLQRLEREVKLRPGSPRHLSTLGWAYGEAGQTAKAREILQRLQTTAKSRFVSPLDLAMVAVGLNDRDLAFAQLERAFELRDPNLPFIGVDITYDSIRDDPRFRDLLKRLKLDVYFPENPKK